MERSAPTEFLRNGEDGKPALRRGVNLVLTYWPTDQSRSAFGQTSPAEELKPTRTAWFDPGDAARPLAPAEEFEAFRMDLNDWFDVTRSGVYHLCVTFAADSGVGEGKSNAAILTIGDPEARAPE